MKRSRYPLALLLLVGCTYPVFAQTHLVPEPGQLLKHDEYHYKLRMIFSKGYDPNVILRAVILPSFQSEQLVGIREGHQGSTVFVLTPASSVWNTELVRLQESGSIKTLDNNGVAISNDKNTSFQELKKRTPPDFRHIAINENARKLSDSHAKRITALWRALLINVHYSTGESTGLDGTTVHFSMWTQDYGVMSGQAWGPDPGPAGALSLFAEKLALYAAGRERDGELDSDLEDAERIIQVPNRR